jgi:rubrerythrin
MSPRKAKERSDTVATSDNLQAAFAGESQANRKYLAFAKKAEADGLPQVAKLFRAAATAETVHAHAHLRVMGGIKETTDNLQAAIDGEGHEFREMYPDFLKEAESEGNKAAVATFRNAMAAEEIHHDLYSKALEAVKAGSDLPATSICVCEVCGCTVEDGAPDKCPICGAPKEKFSEVK